MALICSASAFGSSQGCGRVTAYAALFAPAMVLFVLALGHRRRRAGMTRGSRFAAR